MNKIDRKIICILIIIIIFFSSILLYKIEKSPKYDKDLYEQVYKEYEQISNISDYNEITNDITEKDIIYITEGITESSSVTVGTIDIPKIDISYPIINECTEENLNIAPTKLVGPNLNNIGNFVIIAHNNWNGDFFSNLYKLEEDDIVELTNVFGKKVTYKVYDKYEIKQDDFSCLEQDTDGKIELTLITCIKYKKNKRLVLKCEAI